MRIKARSQCVRERYLGIALPKCKNSTPNTFIFRLTSEPRITTPPVDESDTIDLPVKTRQLPGGQSSGVQIDTYTDAHCKGPHLSNISLIYDSPIGYPLQSYYLHSDIGPNDKLWSYTLLSDPSAPADPSSEQKANINCALNMFNDNDVEGTAGCHSLQFKAGCIMIGDIQGEIN